MKQHIWNYVENKKMLNKPKNDFYSNDSNYPPSALMTALQTIAILSINFMRWSPGNVFQVLKKFPQVPCGGWLLCCFHPVVQTIPTELRSYSSNSRFILRSISLFHDLVKIQSRLDQHGNHNIMHGHAIPTGQ